MVRALRDDSFDYLIVGAGSAGCVLANRLSEDPKVSVALIEAGGKDNQLHVRMPAGLGRLMGDNPVWNWRFYTTPQTQLEGRQLFWPRGKGWGGSSSINGMIYTRGAAHDYDGWAKMGLDGWSYADLLPYFLKAETFDGPPAPWHGTNGPMHVDVSPLDNPLYLAFLRACEEAGLPRNDDFNGAEQFGAGAYQRTIKRGERASSSRAYLHPVLETRSNLTVISSAMVSRVIIEQGEARGIEFVDEPGGLAEAVFADREVILCAGAVQSPQLLMLSGIGPAHELERQEIRVRCELPEVGENLQDHLDMALVYDVHQPITAHSAHSGWRKHRVSLQYLLTGGGPGADNLLQAGGFARSSEDQPHPDLQLHFVNAPMIQHGLRGTGKDGMTIHICHLHPESRGRISLRSSDPFAPPLIDPNYLSAESDWKAMRAAVKLGQEIAGQKAFRPYRGRERVPREPITNDETLMSAIRKHAETIYHPVGTCRMGVDEASVVDEELRVRGVERLRVVDASIFPKQISGNTNAPVIMIAEKAADMIRGRAPLKPIAPEAVFGTQQD
ncbi:MAG: choline dehydrogenase [Hirschia sp.]|nr:choline dehydrogenase [Hirschia sp.]MBF19200.1 choline dehydrogenase [Hirschia sp.]